jgi:hypothetical protein
MAGYSRLYVIGEPGGFEGADGVNPIDFLILVGEGHRQWLEPHYFNKLIKPLGRLQTIVPSTPDDPDSLIDACVAFHPNYFRRCTLLSKVQAELADTDRLDFDAGSQAIPAAWKDLREQARPYFLQMHVWQASLTLLQQNNRSAN